MNVHQFTGAEKFGCCWIASVKCYKHMVIAQHSNYFNAKRCWAVMARRCVVFIATIVWQRGNHFFTGQPLRERHSVTEILYFPQSGMTVLCDITLHYMCNTVWHIINSFSIRILCMNVYLCIITWSELLIISSSTYIRFSAFICTNYSIVNCTVGPSELMVNYFHRACHRQSPSITTMYSLYIIYILRGYNG